MQHFLTHSDLALSEKQFLSQFDKGRIIRSTDLETLERLGIQYGDRIIFMSWDGLKSTIFGAMDVDALYGIPQRAIQQLMDEGKIEFSRFHTVRVAVGASIDTVSMISKISLDSLVRYLMEHIDIDTPLYLGGDFIPTLDLFKWEKVYSNISYSPGIRFFDIRHFCYVLSETVPVGRMIYPKVNGLFLFHDPQLQITVDDYKIFSTVIVKNKVVSESVEQPESDSEE